MTTRRQLILAAALGTTLTPLWAADGSWPSRPIRIVTGGAGSVTDIRARWLAQRLARSLGRPVTVENNGAAGGNVGAEQVARSRPDGYTLLVIHQGTAAVNPHLYERTGYDPLKDFAPITRFGHGSLLLTVPVESAVHSVAGLIDLAKAHPGTLNYGSPGIGTPPHLASELFKRMAGIEAVHVPYRGGGALMSALLSGQITWSMDGLTAQIPHVRSGRLRALGVTGNRRSGVLPDVPTIAEGGLPGYEYQGWTGLAAPSGTNRSIVERLYSEIAAIASDDDARDWFAASGAEAGLMTPEAFADFIRAEYVRWGKVVREAGIKPE